jgi:hypothetical protein
MICGIHFLSKLPASGTADRYPTATRILGGKAVDGYCARDVFQRPIAKIDESKWQFVANLIICCTENADTWHFPDLTLALATSVLSSTTESVTKTNRAFGT